MSTAVERRFPVGAELVAGAVNFRVWAPRRKQVEVVLEESLSVPLLNEGDGYFSGVVQSARPGMHYRFRLDCGEQLVPDPASRFQPEGPHGPSQIVDPFLYGWKDDAWTGVQLDGQIIYEMHIATFSHDGTWTAACGLLPELAEIGITLVEIMPVAEFSGNFGWGYDGTALFAPRICTEHRTIFARSWTAPTHLAWPSCSTSFTNTFGSGRKLPQRIF